MMPFEEELKRAMARREPSEDFTSRVLARVEQEQPGGAGLARWGWFPRGWALKLAAATAALVVVSGSAVYEQHERAVRGEAAKEKLLTAVRIAGVKLHQVRRRVLEVEAEEVRQ